MGRSSQLHTKNVSSKFSFKVFFVKIQEHKRTIIDLKVSYITQEKYEGTPLNSGVNYVVWGGTVRIAISSYFSSLFLQAVSSGAFLLLVGFFITIF